MPSANKDSTLTRFPSRVISFPLRDATRSWRGHWKNNCPKGVQIERERTRRRHVNNGVNQRASTGVPKQGATRTPSTEYSTQWSMRRKSFFGDLKKQFSNSGVANIRCYLHGYFIFFNCAIGVTLLGTCIT